MSAPNNTIGATRALADFAFGSQTRVADTSRPLAWLSPEEMNIDLADPIQRRFGDYELIEKIGQGGMGVVYRARQHGLERDVAIKLLAAGPWASEEFVARFRREAKSAARMQHPNIVEIYEFGHRDGFNYFSMRLIQGQSLAHKLATDGAMPVIEAAKLLRTLADAMDYAHRLGVLHLDLKPANILMTQNGEPLIADFGLARRIDAGHEGGTEISGTPSYMAPEQAQLESHPLTASTDIYGLGAILYELLTGRPPFTASNAQQILERVIAEVPKSPRHLDKSIPADLDAICMKCLEKDPGQRYVSARSLADDLARFTEGHPVSVRPLGIGQRSLRWMRREPRVALATSGAFLALAIGAVVATVQWREAEFARELAQQQSTRSERLTILIAQAFPTPKNSETQSAVEEASARVVAWLDGSLAGDPMQQQELLLKLVDELDRADNPGAAQSLLQPVVAKLGNEFRLQAAEAQIAKGTPRGKVLGAMLMESDAMTPQTQQRQQTLLADAMREAPQDVDVLAAAAYYCKVEQSPCDRLNPGLQLAKLQPDNAANWAYAMRAGHDETTHMEHLRRAGTATRIDDHFKRVMRLNLEAVKTSGVALPPLLIAITHKLSPEVNTSESIAHLQAWAMPVPRWNLAMKDCRPDQPRSRLTLVRDYCLNVGRLAAFEGDSVLTNMIGSTIVRHMRPDDREVSRARELRRRYVYVIAMLVARTPAQIRASREGLVGQDFGQFTEIEAFKRSLDRAGIPRDPPVDWKPEQPEELMTGMEREVYRKRQAALALENLVPEAAQ